MQRGVASLDYIQHSATLLDSHLLSVRGASAGCAHSEKVIICKELVVHCASMTDLHH